MGRDLLVDSRSEVRVVRIRAQIDERQHRKRVRHYVGVLLGRFIRLRWLKAHESRMA